LNLSPIVCLQDVLLGLVAVYNTTKTENVKATTASTLSRLLRSSPELLPVLLERCGPQLLLKGAPGCSNCAAESAPCAHG
jgi:ABC-type arginine transport system permease subunit